MLAMHHFIVGNGQDEMLGIGIDQAEAHLVVVIAAVHRVVLDVVQGVMHPAHVPLVGEAQATLLGGLTDTRPGGGFFGDDQRARRFMGGHTVEVADEIDGLQVLAPAMAVGHPLASLARIVAVQHRGHRIDP